MFRKTLLLNQTFEALRFIPFRKMLKLVLKGKAEVISNWENETISWDNGEMRYPSILRLKIYVKRNFYNTNFSRRVLVKRDNSRCQYCNKKLTPSQVTIDHVLPRSQDGATSFVNCVVSCHECNNRKANRTPEEAGMILLRKPSHPSFVTDNYIDDLQEQEYWHSDWDIYLK